MPQILLGIAGAKVIGISGQELDGGIQCTGIVASNSPKRLLAPRKRETVEMRMKLRACKFPVRVMRRRVRATLERLMDPIIEAPQLRR